MAVRCRDSPGPGGLFPRSFQAETFADLEHSPARLVRLLYKHMPAGTVCDATSPVVPGHLSHGQRTTGVLKWAPADQPHMYTPGVAGEVKLFRTHPRACSPRRVRPSREADPRQRQRLAGLAGTEYPQPSALSRLLGAPDPSC